MLLLLSLAAPILPKPDNGPQLDSLHETPEASSQHTPRALGADLTDFLLTIRFGEGSSRGQKPSNCLQG
jgi:hypothetical protein